jgi:predicted Zn-dependent protease
MQSKGGFGRFLFLDVCVAATVSFRAPPSVEEIDVIRVFRRIAVIVMSLLALTHCAQYPFKGDKNLELMSEQQEIQMGAQAHPDVLQEYPALDNSALQTYVNEVGQRLARQSRRPSLQWHFTVVDSPDVNAFSLPGGYVYITRGILAYLNSEAELAAVIGHEIGHVTAHHAMHQQSVSTPVGQGAVLGSILEPGMNNQARSSRMQSLAKVWKAGYGRERELESDRLGAECLAKAGYSLQAMTEVIGVLKNQALFSAEQAKRDGHQPHPYHGAFATDPSNDARLKHVVDEAKKYSVANPREGRSDFLQKVAGIYFGDSPDQIQIRNNLLLDEKRGLAIQFPQGWQVQNHLDRIWAMSPQGDALIELQPEPNSNTPLETLQNRLELDAGVRFDSGSLKGYPAAFAAGAHQGKPVVAAAVVFNGAQYLIAGMASDKFAYDRERNTLRGAINSFRAITPTEKLAARPFTLQVITARPGMTMASLALQSPLGADAESQLRLMNDLYPSGEPKPGQLLKIVH